MGLKFSDLENSRWKRINADANRFYMAHREEMETTCFNDGEVRYVRGGPPEPVAAPLPKSVTFTPGGGTNVKHQVPQWRIEQKKRYDADRLRTYEQMR